MEDRLSYTGKTYKKFYLDEKNKVDREINRLLILLKTRYEGFAFGLFANFDEATVYFRFKGLRFYYRMSIPIDRRQVFSNIEESIKNWVNEQEIYSKLSQEQKDNIVRYSTDNMFYRIMELSDRKVLRKVFFVLTSTRDLTKFEKVLFSSKKLKK